MPEKGKKSLPINEETHRQIKTAAGERGMFVSDLIDEMWRQYTSPPTEAVHARDAKPSPRNAEWHALLDTILDHGSKEDVTGIQANLRWGAEAVQRRKPAKSRAAS